MSPAQPGWLGALSDALAQGEVIIDPAALALAAHDVFDDGIPPAAIIRPRAEEALSRALMLTSAAGVPVAAKGGGMSYSRGWLPDRAAWVLIDTTALSAIIGIDPVDMKVTVETGCTWATLDAALKAEGLATPFGGPASGRFATIGGTLSQNAALYGSAAFGAAAESVLGLDVMLADGGTIRVGAGEAGRPCLRSYGPDLIGLFLGDSGALGVKIRATLRLIPRPAASAFASYGFAEPRDCAAALGAIGRAGLASECFAFDPSVLARATPPKPGQPLHRAAAGREFPVGSPETLHVAADGRSAPDADEKLELIDLICLGSGGARMPFALMAAMRQDPFPPPTMLIGPGDRRWVPVHAIVPHSQFLPALEAIDRAMDEAWADIERYDIIWGRSALPIGNGLVLIEPNIYWPDARTPFIDAYLGRDASAPAHAPNPAARRFVAALRDRLILACQPFGAAHLQIGRLFPYRDALDGRARGLLQAVKRELDPRGLMNPGALGLE
jgi:FAD/FMN-containing dehydrogenase